jgi:hypothetical protein
MRPDRARSLARSVALAGLAVLGCPAAVLAQATTSRPLRVVAGEATATHEVVAGAKYRAGRLHRWLAGSDYRDVWSAPVHVQPLDLMREGGGLRPLKRGGSMQTNSLRLAGGDGREYVFRPLEKDFTRGLPDELRETFVRHVAQDQVAGYHPAAALVVARLLDATPVPHVRPRLTAMPRDTALGPFLSEFAGVLGMLEERPTAGFSLGVDGRSAHQVISSEELFARLRRGTRHLPDAQLYLIARLFDIVVGDRDRHADQWRWARVRGDTARWLPIPRDRDMPFARFEGLGPWLARGVAPQLVTFGDAYPDMTWLNWNARAIDRRLLAPLDAAAWTVAAATLQQQLDDATLREAVHAMPEPYVHVDGARLLAALRTRRDNLPMAAAAYYRVLAREVDVEATDARDIVRIVSDSSGAITLSMYAEPTEERREDADAWFQRRFLPGETEEVRIFLHGGDDRLTIVGCADGPIRLRIIGGPGRDTVHDATSSGYGRVLAYDDPDGVVIESATRVRVDERMYESPSQPAARAPRDWGSWSFVQRGLGYAPQNGVLLSANHTRIDYGFRHDPFRSRSIVRADVSLPELRPRLTWAFERTRPNSGERVGGRLTASGIELLRFHGFGNETEGSQSDEAYRVRQRLLRAEPSWSVALDDGVRLEGRAILQHTRTEQERETILSAQAPYGSGRFTQVGLGTHLSIDRRDSPTAPRTGYLLDAALSAFPSLGSVRTPFATARATIAGYATPSAARHAPTIALRLGGQHGWGTLPVHESATIGGAESLRGWDVQRFTGRSSLHGSAEARMHLLRTKLLVPSDVGVLAFSDLARVFADDESSGRWHSSRGAGVWIAPMARAYTLSLSVAAGRERTAVYVAHGFAF